MFKLLLIALHPTLAATSVPASFAHLTELTVAGNIKVYYDPKSGTPLSSAANSEGVRQVLEIKDSGGQPWTVSFDPGPSEDPTFCVVPIRQQTDCESHCHVGEQLFYAGGDAVYITGRTDEYFQARRKFSLRDGKLLEVQQPYLYVGQESTTTQPTTLTARTDGGSTVATLPKGAQVTVLLAADEHHYLVATSFGLLGWVVQEDRAFEGAPLQGIFFAGD